MKKNTSSAFILFLAFSSLGFGAEPPPHLITPGGVWWKPKTRITISGPLALTQSTRLEADEVVIDGPILSQGNRLDIFARRVVFGPKGTIRAFDQAAPAGKEGTSYNGPAAQGGKSGRDGAKGSDGATGKEGYSGINGLGAEGPWPGEVSLFAAEITGNPRIEGVGQFGGAGGKGGKGQKGGTGGPGDKAVANWAAAIFGGNRAAGKGGPGGKFGKGGRGAAGGKGGLPVPISVFLAAHIDREPEFLGVYAKLGKGGAGGEGGVPGEPGDGGPGGPSAISVFLFFSQTEPGGPDGSRGEGPNLADKAACTEGEGAAGADCVMPNQAEIQKRIGRSTFVYNRSFSDFEKARFDTTLAWYEFHWWRFLELLAQTSLPLILEEKPTEAASLDTLLQNRIKRNNLQLVHDKWNKNLVRPLQKAAVEYRSDARISQKLETILPIVQNYTSLLERMLFRGGASEEDIRGFKDVLSKIRKARKDTLPRISLKCERFVKEVLKSDEYKKYLQGRQFYYEIPACLEIAEFSEERGGVMRPIELTKDIDVVVAPAFSSGLKSDGAVPSGIRESRNSLFEKVWSLFESTAFAEELPARFHFVEVPRAKLTLGQIREFYPRDRQAVKLASLGVHKGFAMPDKSKITLESLGDYLYPLALIIGGNLQ